jgi:hypothetical protein
MLLLGERDAALEILDTAYPPDSPERPRYAAAFRVVSNS